METTLYFYTGTGNSLWAARKIGSLLNPAHLIPISRHPKASFRCTSQCIGLVFPVHIWGLPPPVVDFVSRLKTDPGSYLFAVAVNAGQVAATLLQLQELLRTNHLRLSSGFSLELPSNYIVWRGAVSVEKQRKIFEAATQKMESIASIVRLREERPPEKGPFWQNPFFSWTYRKTFPHISKMDKSFSVDEKCNACGICARICPAQNIHLTGEKPFWQHRCEQCFACIQWCPEEAIQHGKNTKNKKRYHHPEISLKDMLSCVPQRNS
jgi:ferredoxin